MKRLLVFAAALVVGALALTPPARAERVPSSRVQIDPQHGTKPDIRVPYTTNGNSNLGVYQGVAPRIYSAPDIDDPTQPQARRVYNLPFYGGIVAFSGIANGAMSRPNPYPLSR